MNHLIVYAHPYSKSFNHAILETAVQSYEKKGHNVIVRNLYEIGFQPVLTAKDIVSLKNNSISEDIQIEQQFVKEADFITLIYPIWWAGLPAIVKGYFDRVFSHGFAYMHDHETKDIKKLLVGKKGFIINTHGTSNFEYDQTKMTEALKNTSDIGIFDFVGIQPLGHLLFGDFGRLSKEEYNKILGQISNTIDNIF